MKMSESIAHIAAALSKAQGMIDDATKTGLNPAFRSKYADLAAVRAVIREPLAVNDLAIVQGPRRADGGVEVETMLIHKSGEWISEAVFIPITKWDAHGTGSGITYGRRYGLMSILCIATEDDDGNSAVEKGGPAAPKRKVDIDIDGLMDAGLAASQNGMKSLSEWYQKLTEDQRNALPPELKTALKSKATAADKAEKQ
jgi:ERF superfamily